LKAKKKADYVDKILRRIEIVHQDQTLLQKVQQYVESCYLQDPAPLHKFYREWFNLVDLTDRYWYDVQEAHQNTRWKSKMLFGIMRMFVINSWTLSVFDTYTPWLDFQNHLAKELIETYMG